MGKAWSASEKKKRPLAEAVAVASKLARALERAGATRVEVAGSIRRKRPEVGDVDVVVLAPMGAGQLLERVEGAEVVQGGEEKAFGRYGGMAVNVWVAKPDGWGAMLFYATGPMQYSGFAYRSRAKRRGMLLNQHGLYAADGRKVAGETEEGIYDALDKTWKAPELRGER